MSFFSQEDNTNNAPKIAGPPSSRRLICVHPWTENALPVRSRFTKTVCAISPLEVSMSKFYTTTSSISSSSRRWAR